MRLSGTKTTAIHQYRGLGNQFYDLAGTRPSLDLTFADSKSLVDATTGQNLVTFTRASSGTYVDSQGVIRTATTNLLLRSEEFNNVAWVLNTTGTGIAPVLTANYATAPNGTLTAYRLQANRGAGNNSSDASNIAQAVSGLSDPHTVTISIWAKSNTGNSQSVYFRNATGSGGSVIVVTADWQRFSITGTRSGNTNNNIQIGSRGGINADNSVDILIWGAQLEQSNTVGEYIPTTSTINSAPRFDHNPTTGESLGLLVEESRTNLLLRSEEFGTTWTATRSSITADATTAPNNTLTADKLVEDTTATNSHQLQQSATIVANTTYTVSCFIKAAERSELRFLFVAGGDGINALFNLGTGIATAQANTGSGSIVSASLTPVGNGWFRAVCTGIVSPTSTAATLTMRLISSGANSYTGDGTSGLFIWGAQLEAGAFPTSYIPTTTATVTRSADVASITGSNFSSWYRQDEGTVFLDAASFQSVAAANAGVVINDGTLNNRIEIDVRAGSLGGAGRLTVISGGAVSFDTGNSSTPAFAVNTFYRQGASYKLDSFAFSLNGGVAQTDTSGGVPTAPDRIEIGARLSTALPLNGTLRRLTYWPQRLPNETLQQITQ